MLSKKVFHAVNALVVMAGLPTGNTITTAELADLLTMAGMEVERDFFRLQAMVPAQSFHPPADAFTG